MYYLVETLEQLEQVDVVDDVYIDVISNNDNYHAVLQQYICLIYVRPIHYQKGFIISIRHHEASYLSMEDVRKWINKCRFIFTPDSYRLKRHMPYVKNTYDVKHIAAFLSIKLDNVEIPDINLHFNKTKIDHVDLNQLIPISKHYELKEQEYIIFEEVILRVMMMSYDETFNINDFGFSTHSLEDIQTLGIKISKDVFKEHSDVFNCPKLSIYQGRMYSMYTFSPLTLRPYNSFNGFSLNTIPKNDSKRTMIIPEYDYLMEIDYKSYHLYLIADLIQYDFKDDFGKSVYEILGPDILGESTQSPESIKKVKAIVLPMIYGGISEKYLHIPFFKKLKEYVDDVWETYKINDILILPWGKIISDIEDANPHKLLNYIIQATETYYNLGVIERVRKSLDAKAKIIIYNFDSILIDISKNYLIFEPNRFVNTIKTIMGYPVEIKIGKNYNSLEIFDPLVFI